MLELTPEARDAMVAHAIACLPDEACGMVSVARDASLVDRFHPLANDAASPTAFRLDPQEMLDLERQTDTARRDLTGVMHSHPTTSPYPSPTDLADVARFDPFGSMHHVIVSLRAAEPMVRSFRISDGQVTEELVVVAGDEPIVHDQAGAMAAVTRLPRRP